MAAELEPLGRRAIGTTEVRVTEVGLGGAPLGGLHGAIDERTAQATVEAALESGIGWFDTAPFYGHGTTELRFGHVLRQVERQRFTLSSKVGRLLKRPPDGIARPSPFHGRHAFDVVHDYGYDATMRSLEDSWQRLGMNRIDIALIHDVDPMHQGDAYEARFAEAVDGACRALEELKVAGVIGAFGIGVNQIEPCHRFADAVDLDCVMLARSYTLLDQVALPPLLERAGRGGFSLLIAGAFASGILATGPIDGALHNYAPAGAEVLERTRRLDAICRAHAVSLAAAALQFPLLRREVAAVAAGAVTSEQARALATLARTEIPPALWRDLEGDGLLDAALLPDAPANGPGGPA